MNLPDALLPHPWYWLGYLAFLPLLADSIVRGPWRRLKDPALLNAWLGTVVCLLGLWQITTGVKPGLNFHFLGATLFTLMFGPRLALAGLSLAVLGTALYGGSGWQALGLNGLTMAAIPVAVSYWVFRFIDRYLPNHFFVYIFVSAFVGAAVALTATGLATTFLVGAAGTYPLAYLLEHYLPYYLMLAWSEALFTGMGMTLLVVYKPDWVATFDDQRYLRNK